MLEEEIEEQDEDVVEVVGGQYDFSDDEEETPGKDADAQPATPNLATVALPADGDGRAPSPGVCSTRSAVVRHSLSLPSSLFSHSFLTCALTQ